VEVIAGDEPDVRTTREGEEEVTLQLIESALLNEGSDDGDLSRA
jgi:hypothetical protein